MSISGRQDKRRIKTPWDAVLALYQLVDYVLPPEFDLAEIFASAARILADSKAQPTKFVSDGVTAQQEEDQSLRESYNELIDILFKKKPLANTPHNIAFIKETLASAQQVMLDTFSEEKPEEIAMHLGTLLSQPDSLTRKGENTLLSPLVVSLSKELMRYLRQQLTTVERYNRLVTVLIDTPPPPLIDTQTNAEYAVTVLAAVMAAATLELGHRTPPVASTEIDTFITKILGGGEPTPKDETIVAALQVALQKSLHTALDIFNNLQKHFIYPDLPNTVENNELAKKTLQAILQILVKIEEFGQESAEAFLSKIISTPDFDEKQLSPLEQSALTIVNEQLLMAMYPTYKVADRPDLYPRIMADIAARDTNVLLAEKISLLTRLSALLADRPQYAPIGSMDTDPMMQTFEKAGNFTEALAVNVIKKLYAMRFGEEEPELELTQETIIQSIEPEESTEAPAPATQRATTPTTTQRDTEPDDTEEKEKQRRAKHIPQPKKEMPTLHEKRERIQLEEERKRQVDVARANRSREQEEREDKRREAELAEEKERYRLASTAEMPTRSLIEGIRNLNQQPVDLFKPRKIDSDLVGIMDEVDEKIAAPISDKRALHDRIFEYTTMFISPADPRKHAARQLQSKQRQAYEAHLTLLLSIIQEACAFSGKPILTEMNTRLTQRFAQASEPSRRLNFSELYADQASILNTVQGIPTIEKSKNVTRLLATRKIETIQRNLVNQIIQFCEPLKQSHRPEEKTMALQLLKACQTVLAANPWNPAEFSRLHSQAVNLAMSFITPEEMEALEFLPRLAVIHSNPKTTEETLLDAFKKFLSVIMPDKADNLIADFRQKINAPRLQQMKHIALQFLDNLESIYITAYGDNHPRKTLFSEYREKILGLATTVSDAPQNETALMAYLTEFTHKTGREISIHADEKGILHETRTAAENDRLQLLTLFINYNDSLNALKKLLDTDLAAQLTPVTDATQAYMQLLLTVEKQRLPVLRSEIEKASVGFEQSIDKIIADSKHSSKPKAPSTAGISRALGQLNLLSETRNREKVIADRQKALAAIFKSGPAQKK